MRRLELQPLHVNRTIKGLSILGIVLAPFAFIAFMTSWFATVAGSDPHRLHTQASVIRSNSAIPSKLPPVGWKTVTLPNRTLGDGVLPASIWYRIEVDIAEPSDELWAVYLPRTSANHAVYINDSLVGDGGSMGLDAPLHLEPLLFEFPGKLLRPGKNIVDIRSVRASTSSSLAEFQLGRFSELAPVYRDAYFLKKTLKTISVVCMLTVALMMATLFRFRSRDAVFGWFAIALFFWAAHISIILRPEPLFGDWRLWSSLQCIAIGFYVISLSFFINRFVGVKTPRFETILVAWGVTGAVALLLEPWVFGVRTSWLFSWVWFPPLSAVTLFQEYQLLMSVHRRRDADSMFLAAIGWFVLIIGLRDTAIDMGLARGVPTYTHYTVIPLLLVFGFILLRRFAYAVTVAERARGELEIRVAQKSAELEHNLIRLKDMEREQALSAERERIMRDMHDGVGGQLVQVLSLAANQPALKPVEEPLRNCLEDLSLIIDSIEPVNGDLASILGMLRMRMSHRLEEAGVRLNWEIADIPALTDLGPQRVLQVTRIVQEAIANALKHSHADRITVRALVTNAEQEPDSRVTIEVIDNGSGMVCLPGGRTGRGLGNMRKRAADLNGSLRVDSCERGTTVRLDLPLRTADARLIAAAK